MKKETMKLLEFDPGKDCIIVGEVGQAHDGSLGTAHAFIDAIASASADAVKFQTHIAAAESSPAETFRVKFSRQDATRQNYWKRMEFTTEQWRGLKEHADENGLLFLSSPFSLQAVELLARVGVAGWKIASGEVANVPMLDRMLAEGQPIMLSSGMSDLNELDAAVERVRSHNVPLLVFQCTTAYPCPPQKIGLNMIPLLRERYGCPVGLSDHSGTIYPGLAGATMGIQMLEVHVTLSREMFGPDVPASVTPGELRQLVEGIRFIENAMRCPVDKDQLAQEMTPLRDMFTQSVVTARDVPAGRELSPEDLTTKKPGTGIPAARLGELLGRRLKRAAPQDTYIQENDLE